MIERRLATDEAVARLMHDAASPRLSQSASTAGQTFNLSTRTVFHYDVIGADCAMRLSHLPVIFLLAYRLRPCGLA